MAQYDFATIDLDNTDGGDLASILQQWRDALNSRHSGASRPAYLPAGGLWTKIISGTSWQLMQYDGDTDIIVANINPTTNAVTVPAGSVSTASIVTGAITTALIAAGAITATQMAADAIITAALQDGALTYPKVNSGAVAAASDIFAATASKLVTASILDSAGQQVAITQASSMTPNHALGVNFKILSIAQNSTVNNMINVREGRPGLIYMTFTGVRTMSWGSNYDWGDDGPPTFTADPALVGFWPQSATKIIMRNLGQGY